MSNPIATAIVLWCWDEVKENFNVVVLLLLCCLLFVVVVLLLLLLLLFLFLFLFLLFLFNQILTNVPPNYISVMSTPIVQTLLVVTNANA